MLGMKDPLPFAFAQGCPQHENPEPGMEEELGKPDE